MSALSIFCKDTYRKLIQDLILSTQLFSERRDRLALNLDVFKQVFGSWKYWRDF